MVDMTNILSKVSFFLAILLLSSCNSDPERFDIQGHRGARGLMPENSIPGFLKAIKLGVTTLEMDVVVTKDSVLVVSHEPYFSNEFCQDTLGNRIGNDNGTNLYEMTYAEILKYDCGSIDHPRFPDQRKISTTKSKLIDVLDTVSGFSSQRNSALVNFNIELKTKIATDDIFHPKPHIFSEMVFDLLADLDLLDRTTIQSFDFRTLQYFQKHHPEVKLALLIENNFPWKQNIDSLGFGPDVYSCNYQLLSRTVVREMQKNNIDVIPWTVNDVTDMKELINWGVDGIITDYPDRLIDLTRSNK